MCGDNAAYVSGYFDQSCFGCARPYRQQFRAGERPGGRLPGGLLQRRFLQVERLQSGRTDAARRQLLVHGRRADEPRDDPTNRRLSGEQRTGAGRNTALQEEQ